jgi:hypothetical protein
MPINVDIFSFGGPSAEMAINIESHRVPLKRGVNLGQEHDDVKP